MRFAGCVGISMVDYPGDICTTVFTQGCNLDCKYCHNSGMKERKPIIEETDDSSIGERELIERLQSGLKLLHNLTITGGEPTLHGNQLVHFLQSVRSEIPEINIKLDTNGTIYPVVEEAVKYIDYIAVDFKGIYFPYTRGQRENLLKTMELVRDMKSEIRITMYPDYIGKMEEDLKMTVNLLKQVEPQHIFIQQYRKVREGLSEPFDREWVWKLADLFIEEGIECSTRGA